MKRFVTFVAAAAFLAAGIAIAQDKPPAPAPKDKPVPQAPLAKLKNQLGVTPEQEAKLKAFREARQAENKAFAEQMKKHRQEMQALRKDPKSDPKKAEALIDQMFKLRAERAKSGIRTGQEWQKVFTPEQLEKMKQGRNRLMGTGLMRGRGAGMGMMNRPGMRMGRPGLGMGLGMRPGFGAHLRRPHMGLRPFGQRGPGARILGRPMASPQLNRLRGSAWMWRWRFDEE